MVRARVSSKGQLTIPKRVRDALELEEGSVVEIRLENGGAVLTKVTTTFLDRFGTIPPGDKPEDWRSIRKHVREDVARRAVERGLSKHGQ